MSVTRPEQLRPHPAMAPVARREKEAAGDRWQEHGVIFASKVGTPMEVCNLTHRLHRITKAAGLPKIRFHDLRHTAATLLLAQRVHPRLVMEVLGHSSISLTMNTYSHVFPAMQSKVADKMNPIPTPAKSSPETAPNLVVTSMATRTGEGLIN